jgi:energy-converting hydrogenase Eha subunit A
MKEIFSRSLNFIKYYYIVAAVLSVYRAILNFIEPVGRVDRPPLLLQGLGLTGFEAEVAFSVVLAVSGLLLPWFYRSRPLRVVHAVSLLFASAYPIPLISFMSAGIVDLSWLSFFWINFVFIFLPASFSSTRGKYQLAGLIYLNLLMQSMFYFLSGLWKFRLNIEAWLSGDFKNMFLCILSNSQPESPLFSAPEVAAAMYWAAAVFTVICFPLTWMMPRYHRWLALGFFLFHFGIFLVLQINFFPHYLLSIGFFYFSPFVTKNLKRK